MSDGGRLLSDGGRLMSDGGRRVSSLVAGSPAAIPAAADVTIPGSGHIRITAAYQSICDVPTRPESQRGETYTLFVCIYFQVQRYIRRNIDAAG